MAAIVSTKAGVVPPSAGDAHVKAASLGQIVVSRDGEDVLVAYGLGSCVGVVGWDPQARVGGLLHALLPQFRPGDNVAKYVDTGILELLRQMENLGAHRQRIVWYVVGGAAMLKMPDMKSEFDIGSKNAEIARQVMERERLHIKVIDVGGTAGRTVKLSLRDGTVSVKTLGLGEKIL